MKQELSTAAIDLAKKVFTSWGATLQARFSGVSSCHETRSVQPPT